MNTTLVLAGFAVHRVQTTEPAVLLQFKSILCVRLVLRRDVVPPFALSTGKRQRRSLVGRHCLLLSLAVEDELYLVIFMTRPAPTVRPPSRMANRSPSSMAIGAISSTVISVLSPGITI
jgi:hypothetical protein